MPVRKKVYDKSMLVKPGEKFDLHKFVSKLFRRRSVVTENTMLGRPLRKLDYKLLKVLGAGGFGEVFEAEKNEERYACKRQSKAHICDKGMQNMALTEVLVMEHLSGCERTVQLVEAFEDKTDIYMILDLCTGGDVLKAINAHFERDGLFTESAAADMVRDMLLALKQVHDKGVLHRDLKPENFMYAEGPDGKKAMKLTDFGLSVFLEPGQSLYEPCGTPNFVAPECWVGGPYGYESDVWSLGICLAVMLTGKYPVDGDTLQEIGQAAQEPINWTIYPWNFLSDGLRDLIQQMLKRDKRDRITVEDALAHPWVVPGGAPDKNVHTSFRDSITSFQQVTALQRAALRLLADNLTTRELAQMKVNFKLLDKDGDGKVTIKELRERAAELSLMGVGDPDSVMNALDADKNGYVDLREFVDGAIHLRILRDESKIKQAFEEFDVNGDGVVSRSELLSGLRRGSQSIVESDAIWEELDADGDGNVTYDEFLAFWKRHSVPTEPDSQ